MIEGGNCRGVEQIARKDIRKGIWNWQLGEIEQTFAVKILKMCKGKKKEVFINIPCAEIAKNSKSASEYRRNGIKLWCSILIIDPIFSSCSCRSQGMVDFWGRVLSIRCGAQFRLEKLPNNLFFVHSHEMPPWFL